MALLICKGIADILTFRCNPDGVLDSFTATNFPGVYTPGDIWEAKAFKCLRPICQGGKINGIRGLCVNECPAGIAWMKCQEEWLRAVFTEEHWAEPEPMKPPRIEVWALQVSLGMVWRRRMQ